MQCVIMAAGRGTRLQPLTDTIPKPLIKVAGKPILDHIVSALPTEISELIIVVNYRAAQIKDHCGTNLYGRPVTYVEQTSATGGTGAALLAAEPHITNPFLVLNGDDIYGAAGLATIIKEKQAMFFHTSDHPEDFGVLESTPAGTLISITEKPAQPRSNKVNIGGYLLTPEIFQYKTKPQANGEIYLTDMVTDYAAEHPIRLIAQESWIPIGRPEDIVTAEKFLST